MGWLLLRLVMGEISLVDDKKTYKRRRNRGISPFILNIGTRQRCAPPALPPGMNTGIH